MWSTQNGSENWATELVVEGTNMASGARPSESSLEESSTEIPRTKLDAVAPPFYPGEAAHDLRSHRPHDWIHLTYKGKIHSSARTALTLLTEKFRNRDQAKPQGTGSICIAARVEDPGGQLLAYVLGGPVATDASCRGHSHIK